MWPTLNNPKNTERTLGVEFMKPPPEFVEKTVDKPAFYAGTARDFLKDKDTRAHKFRRYMEHRAK